MWSLEKFTKNNMDGLKYSISLKQLGGLLRPFLVSSDCNSLWKIHCFGSVVRQLKLSILCSENTAGGVECYLGILSRSSSSFHTRMHHFIALLFVCGCFSVGLQGRRDPSVQSWQCVRRRCWYLICGSWRSHTLTSLKSTFEGSSSFLGEQW